MSATGRTLSLLLLMVALPAVPHRSEAAGSVDPFHDLDAMSLAIEVGGPMDLEGNTERQLFVDDLRRFNRFRSALTQALTTKLESCGILVDSGEPDDRISVSVFGHLESRPQAAPLVVYLVEATVFNSELEPGRGNPRVVPLRPVIGVAADDGLEAALIEAATAIVSDGLEARCRRSRGGRP